MTGVEHMAMMQEVRLRYVTLLGVPFAAISAAELLEHVRDSLRRGAGGWVLTPNLEILRQIHADPDLDELVSQPTLIVADGTPLIWASKLQGDPLPERVAGSDLVWSVPALAAEEGARVFLLGGNPGAADVAADRLTERNPGLQVVGTYCPPMGFEHDEAELERAVRATHQAAPDVVIAGLPFPKQEVLIARLRQVLPDAWYFGLGVSLSFVAGDVARAPRWMQRTGLEWLHRLAQEPRRLARRYLVLGPPAVLRLLAAALRERLRPGRQREIG
jgi:N-acetylglucosaminyldiphosphoundecaprenol N-acetyl-beta-D-mannosaminyltransferase